MDLSSCRRTCPFTQYLNIFALLCRTDGEASWLLSHFSIFQVCNIFTP